MLELTGDDIAQLSDEDLRELVTLLCVAELRAAGLPTSAVTAGGDQDAADGGLDVRVSLSVETTELDFVKRGICGFQVKVPDMPRGAILKEMRPKGVLRPAIKDLAANRGAYIIVSANGSVSDTSLANRRDAMREALIGEVGAEHLATDFYDRTMLARWTQAYPGVVAWVRGRIGRPIKGWQGYGQWSAPSQPDNPEYINDNQVRLFDSRDPTITGHSAVDGINRMRKAIAVNSSVTRLIGLSGVGKTRLLEGLFDERIGEAALDKSLVVYCDLAHEPEPSPRDMARYLGHLGQPAILIVDNCPPETHAALATICAIPGSKVSAVTVEYDVRDDIPEATQVFRLEAASAELIEQLVAIRAPHVSYVDRRRIAEFSEGNARVALALCNTVGRGETLGVLTDQALFDRLFHQRDRADGTLLRAAEACALVYSFDGETVDGDDAELPRLALLAGQPVAELYRSVGALRSRDLVQRRSKWRALLPHALANKLAKQALMAVHRDTLVACIFNGPARLLVSFSRRLGYLHDSEQAREIVRSWFADDGPFADLTTLDESGWRIVANVAPVQQDDVLRAMERAFGTGSMSVASATGQVRSRLIVLLRSLAYEPAHFRRAALLLAEIAAFDEGERRTDKFDVAFVELFHIHLSGTQARIAARIEVVVDLTRSSDPRRRQIGLQALRGLLQTGPFSSGHDFSFGSRPRDYGWQPATNAEVREWYAAVFAAIEQLLGEPDLLPVVRRLIGESFRNLWRNTGADAELETLSRTISQRGLWSEGWIGVRSSIRWDGKEMPKDMLERLQVLERLLRPQELLDTARTYISAKPWGDLDDADDEDDDSLGSGYARSQQRTLELGKQVAAATEILDELLPLAAKIKSERPLIFAKGLALGASDLDEIWEKIVSAISVVGPKEQNFQLMCGFIAGVAERDPAKAHVFLDRCVDHPLLAPAYPRLQCFMDLEERGTARLHRSLDLKLAEAWVYTHLSFGSVPDDISPDELAKLVSRISGMKEGYPVATQILGMRLFSSRSAAAVTLDVELVDCGRSHLANCDYSQKGDRDDYHLADIARRCLTGGDAEKVARQVCRRFADALADHRSAAHSYDDLLAALFEVQPVVAMDEFLLRDKSRTDARVFRLFDSHRRRPLADVDQQVVLAWAAVDPTIRCVALADAIPVFKMDGTDEDGQVKGWANVALALLELTPEKVGYLTTLAARFRPSGWSGSLADIYEDRRKLPQFLFNHPNEDVREWAKEQDRLLADEAEQYRQREQRRDQSFE